MIGIVFVAAFCRERRRRAGRGDDGYPAANQIGHKLRQPIFVVLCPTVFDRHVAAVDVTSFSQAIKKSRQWSRIILMRSNVRPSDHRHCRLLRLRGNRPGSP
jgi:hypothetical protein